MLNTWPTHTQPLLHDVSLTTEGPTYPPTGERTVWPFPVSWPPAGQSLQETYAFKTEVLTSRSGQEKRLARRAQPRRELRQSALLDGARLRRYKDLLWAWQYRDMVWPDIFRSVALPAEMPAGTDTLVMDDPPYWMLPGAAVVIGSGEQREALAIGGVAGDATYFTAGVTRDWPAGTLVYPGLIGNLAAQIDADRETNIHASADLRFRVRPLSEVPRPPGEPETVFDGREVFTLRPNWAESVSSTLAHEVDVLDYDTGPISRYAAVAFGREITGATYLGGTRAEADALLDLFLRLRGQQGEFWVPTWEPDFLLRSGGTTGEATLRVQGDSVVDAYAGSTVHRAVYVRLRNGTLLFARVLTITLVDDATGKDSLLTLTSAWGQSFATEDVVTAGWLLLRRLASDSLTLEWLTDSVANVQLSLMTLEALPEENPAA